jgi:hypothetical protein
VEAWVGGTRDDSAEAKRARAEVAFAKQQARDEQTATREREEAARVTAIDEKTARLKALRLARDAEATATTKAKRS